MTPEQKCAIDTAELDHWTFTVTLSYRGMKAKTKKFEMMMCRHPGDRDRSMRAVDELLLGKLLEIDEVLSKYPAVVPVEDE